MLLADLFRFLKLGAAFAITEFLLHGNIPIVLRPACVYAVETSSEFKAEVAAKMKEAATYYREKVALHGGYVYYYSLDLSSRLGEGVASPTEIWVQPPGTPAVGMAFLNAYRATHDTYYLDAAIEAAAALIYGQLESGCWQNSVDFEPGKSENNYRNGYGGSKRNYSTLDDDISQSALTFLITMDKELEFKNEKIHEAAEYGFNALLNAQFANGAFPQVWDKPVDRSLPVVKAKFPERMVEYGSEERIGDYWHLYTLNDDLAGTVFRTLKTGYEIYGDEHALTAIKKLGDFLILAQLPDPQPIWAQQYDYEMRPVWARKFEPPAATGSESQDVLETLMSIYEMTGDERYLEPIPSALTHLKKCVLPDGQICRYQELKTNRPLFMERKGKEYFLTYSDANLPSHYGWKRISRLDEIEMRFDGLKSKKHTASTTPPAADSQKVAQIIQSLDDQNRWITTAGGQRLVGQPRYKEGDKFISSEEFCYNMELLSEYLSETNKK